MAVTQRIGLNAGDIVEVSARRVGEHGRNGEIVEVLGAEAQPHYLVRWEDGHTSIFYPGEGTTFRRLSPPPRSRVQKSRKETTDALVGTLRDHGVEVEVLPHRPTTSAVGEARALGVLAQTVAKTLVARDEHDQRVRAVVPASSRLDLRRLADVVGSGVRLLSESELAHDYPEFELGAVPPFGGPEGDRVVVDRSLGETDHVVVEAGVHNTSLRLLTEDLLAVAHAEIAAIAAD